MARQIFLDMDGVIVDLPCPIQCTPDELLLFYKGQLQIDQEILWKSTDADWWANLPWTTEGHEIVKLCEQAAGAENVIICTKPADAKGSAEGKLRWLDKHLPDYRQRFILTPQKQWVASPRNLLIDDSDHNISKYAEAGGPTILCPRPWNENHGFHTLEYIDLALKDLQ